MDQNTLDFITAVKALADSPLPKFFLLIGVSVVIGYALVMLDTVRRATLRR